jgi:hypothetical protein
LRTSPKDAAAVEIGSRDDCAVNHLYSHSHSHSHSRSRNQNKEM